MYEQDTVLDTHCEQQNAELNHVLVFKELTSGSSCGLPAHALIHTAPQREKRECWQIPARYIFLGKCTVLSLHSTHPPLSFLALLSIFPLWVPSALTSRLCNLIPFPATPLSFPHSQPAQLFLCHLLFPVLSPCLPTIGLPRCWLPSFAPPSSPLLGLLFQHRGQLQPPEQWTPL